MSSFDYTQAICLGIAGNIAGHLIEAGEAAYFKEGSMPGPKGIFPTYLPNNTTHPCGVFPVSHDKIIIPRNQDMLQIEPELALVGEISYKNNEVSELKITGFAAYNDLSIRNPNATKISLKKNWGPQSKGFGPLISLLKFDHSQFQNWRIASWHFSQNSWHPYGIDTAVLDYSYFGSELKDWIINQLNSQEDESQLENMPILIQESKQPKYFAIGCGATRYSDWGKSNFVKEHDLMAVLIYQNETALTEHEYLEILNSRSLSKVSGSLLIQEAIFN